MKKTTAMDRLQRVLAIVPWIVANPDHTVADIASRFAIAEKELLADLDVVYLVGLPPYSPDALVDVQIDSENRVRIELADYFSRPLRLTLAQAFGLLVSLDALMAFPGTHQPTEVLASAVKKIRSVVGLPGDALGVHMGESEDEVIDLIRTAVLSKKEITISYFSYGRDEAKSRNVSPWRIFSDVGQWYLAGWCHDAADERLFRVDRIESLEMLDVDWIKEPHSGLALGAVFNPDQSDPQVVLRLDKSARWVLDAYPCELTRERRGGVFEISMVVTAVPWLERLLLRLGPAVSIVDCAELPEAEGLKKRAAEKVLLRYS